MPLLVCPVPAIRESSPMVGEFHTGQAPRIGTVLRHIILPLRFEQPAKNGFVRSPVTATERSQTLFLKQVATLTIGFVRRDFMISFLCPQSLSPGPYRDPGPEPRTHEVGCSLGSVFPDSRSLPCPPCVRWFLSSSHRIVKERLPKPHLPDYAPCPPRCFEIPGKGHHCGRRLCNCPPSFPAPDPPFWPTCRGFRKLEPGLVRSQFCQKRGRR